MVSRFSLFEISWETCNKVGGIHTVLSTKAKTLVERLGDDYVVFGPWLLSGPDAPAIPFQEETGFEEFAEACREMGVPVRVGRWLIPGRPRTVLVEFSGLYGRKDPILAKLWEDWSVDSLSGQWDYVEPVLFGHAVGMVIERWWEEFLAPQHQRLVVQAHEWMTAAALLYLKKRIPSVGTLFTTHATMLGRALSSVGHNPEDGLGDKTPVELAKAHGVVAKHSMEGIVARQADVFTTVSEVTAVEAEVLHGRRPEPVLYNGIDLDVVDELRGPQSREDVRARLVRLAGQFLGEDVADAALLAVSGRYEFHNKGIDLLLDALAQVNRQPGRRIVLFALVPAGNSGLRSELLERLDDAPGGLDGPVGLSTHNLFDGERDPIERHCRTLGLANDRDARVKVIHVPIYLSARDGLLHLPYEAVLSAMDLTCFPSYYEPWGYTPQESLAMGVPTITSDYAGFGRWALAHDLGPADGVTVLRRVHVEHTEIVSALVAAIEGFLHGKADAAAPREACRKTAAMTAWSDLIRNYEAAFALAVASVQQRLEAGVPQTRKPRSTVPVPTRPQARRPRLTGFDVAATLPHALEGLQRLARNFWWSWNPDAVRLFRELSPASWSAARHDPVRFLQRIYPEDLAARAADPDYTGRLHAVLERFDGYMSATLPRFPLQKDGTGEGDPQSALSAVHPVAYLSAEFAIHESLPVYSGGLGILAGDHLKSASDLNLPLVGVGLFYRYGYMTQRIGANGEQLAADVPNDPRQLAMEPVLEAGGTPLELGLQFPGREVFFRAWLVRVGRVALYLLDCDTPTNRQEDREITRQLYGGDHETRLKQEIVLGRGGVRLLRRLGIVPAVWHINEGHAAFLALERVSQLALKEGLTFEAAREFVRATTLFTTHTPVPAGHDRFGEDLMRRYFSDAPDWVGVPWERFFALGKAEDSDDAFNMTYLAASFASRVSGVSKLHRDASRKLLQPFWPSLLESEVPVGSVTNGVHLPTWTHPAIAELLGVKERPVRGADFARNADKIPPAELWKVKRRLKAELLERVGVLLRSHFVERDDSPLLLAKMLDGLDPDALWIGFARRFAPYKRAHLLFKDKRRLQEILDDGERPVRVLIAGKAHPRDEHGKSILKQVVELSRSDDFAGRVFFVEDYAIELARMLVQGVDVWLNTPVRMQEASGTSGMKAAANGALNLSIGDGWWPEAFDGKNGWLIGGGAVYEDQELQDQLDAGTLQRILAEEVVPLFFERARNRLPIAWLERVQHALATIPPMFDTDRMVTEYLESAYRSLGTSYFDLSRDRKSLVKARAAENQRLRREFAKVAIVSAQVADSSDLRVGDTFEASVRVDLAALAPEDVVVELLLGFDRHERDLVNAVAVRMQKKGPAEGTVHEFAARHDLARSGNYACGIRVRARPGPDEADALRDLVLWA